MPDGGWRQSTMVPEVHGVAALASRLFAGESLASVAAMLGPEPAGAASARAGWLMDQSWLCALSFAPGPAAVLQAQALALSRVYRVRGAAGGPRLLALCAPGDLMVNTPLDFITTGCGLSLTLAYLAPDLPPVPAHDVAIVAASESAPGTLAALAPLVAAWPRPVLNRPEAVARLSRDGVAGRLRGKPGLLIPHCWRTGCDVAGPYPLLLRPVGAHGGQGLALVHDAAELGFVLAQTSAEAFYATEFVETRSPDGWYRKYRIAFVDGAPFLCHMAAGDHWMVHYLSAGMHLDPAKRAAEAEAMRDFATGFAARHRAALATVADTLGLDYVSIDCAESPCGRLVVWEADNAAIIHSMDPPDLYPYKTATMQRCYDAFAAAVRRRL